jgi:predicted Rossmann fold nucleotide-binding protein DprA/Smf involved in DNA uptake
MSADPLSAATQATLLLCSPLRAGRNKDTRPLSIGEFNELENQLSHAGSSLEHLLESDASRTLEKMGGRVDEDRIQVLLGRGFLLSMAIELWRSAGIWVVSRGQAGYPERLYRLKQNAPPLIYGCGESGLLGKGGLAMVGSRDVDATGEEFTRAIATRAASNGMQVVSGGARGVDQHAMAAALEAGGAVVGVLADSLLKSASSGKAREGIQEGKLALISPFDPEAGFNVGNAMQRNKHIYALADFGLVVSSGLNEGGTWAGAIEQLEKLRLVPLFVREAGPAAKGNRELLRRGAVSWPMMRDGTSLRSLLENAVPQPAQRPETGDLFAVSALREEPPKS